MVNITCPECARVFDLSDANDAEEWAYGHDCESGMGFKERNNKKEDCWGYLSMTPRAIIYFDQNDEPTLQLEGAYPSARKGLVFARLSVNELQKLATMALDALAKLANREEMRAAVRRRSEKLDADASKEN